ncbi:hypothetical protein B0H19DRAFT_1265526 [Mycena capillaripes]|nr:hypothetical protein B0H19DRAFT_1265526 [Mycena capillaripes]
MAPPTFSFSTTADEVATAFVDRIVGKNVLITGTSINGIGFEAARAIAKHANLVVITGYSAERLKLLEEAIREEIPSANIRCLTLDLSSLVAVRTAAAEVNAYPEPLHVIINNAAALIGPFKLTVDGLESQMAINHVGHFLFTKLLLPKLLASRTTAYTPRIVFVSSAAHASCDGVDLDAIEHPSAETYNIGKGYYRSKAANILTTIELARRAGGALKAFSVHPGAIYTNITQKEESREYMQSRGYVDADGKPVPNPYKFKSIPQGAATTVVAAFDPSLEDKSGAYLADCVEDNAAVAPHSSDPVMAGDLWALTEKLIGETFAPRLRVLGLVIVFHRLACRAWPRQKGDDGEGEGEADSELGGTAVSSVSAPAGFSVCSWVRAESGEKAEAGPASVGVLGMGDEAAEEKADLVVPEDISALPLLRGGVDEVRREALVFDVGFASGEGEDTSRRQPFGSLLEPETLMRSKTLSDSSLCASFTFSSPVRRYEEACSVHGFESDGRRTWGHGRADVDVHDEECG